MQIFSLICVHISIAVVDLIQELTDVDTLNESEEQATSLVDALVSLPFSLHSKLFQIVACIHLLFGFYLLLFFYHFCFETDLFL